MPYAVLFSFVGINIRNYDLRQMCTQSSLIDLCNKNYTYVLKYTNRIIYHSYRVFRILCYTRYVLQYVVGAVAKSAPGVRKTFLMNREKKNCAIT